MGGECFPVFSLSCERSSNDNINIENQWYLARSVFSLSNLDQATERTLYTLDNDANQQKCHCNSLSVLKTLHVSYNLHHYFALLTQWNMFRQISETDSSLNNETI